MPFPYNYFAVYAQGALNRIKQLKRETAAMLPVNHYSPIGGSRLVMLLFMWALSNLCCGKKAESAVQIQLGQPETDQSKQDATLASVSPSTVNHPPSTGPFNYSMVSVTGGAYTMGSPAGEARREDDECQHAVTIGSFSIGKYEVTQAQWQAVMGSNPSYHKSCADCPVETVSWNDVQVFIEKLNAATGKRYRLPTEAEWEYAARGGAQSRNYQYAGSDRLAEVAWSDDISENITHPVGGKSPNELGLYDMSGNAMEWCQDIRKTYPCDKKAKGIGANRVCRGGWGGDAQICRTAYRYSNPPEYSNRGLGFRLVASPLE